MTKSTTIITTALISLATGAVVVPNTEAQAAEKPAAKTVKAAIASPQQVITNVAQAQADQTQAQATVIEKTNQINNAQNKADAAKQEVNQAQSQVSQAQANVASAQTIKNTATLENIHQAQSNVNQHQQQVADARTNQTSIQTTVNQASATVATQKAKTNHAQSAVNQAQDAVNSAQQAANSKESAYHQLTPENLQAQKDKATQQVHLAEAAKDAAQTNVQTANTHVTNTADAAADAKVSVDNAHSTTNQAQDKQNLAQQESDKANADKQNAQNVHNDAVSQANKEQDKLNNLDSDKLQSQINNTQSAIVTDKNNLAMTEQQQNQAQTDKSKADQDVTDKTNSLNSANEHVSKTQSNLNTATANQQAAQKDLENKTNAVNNTQSQINAIPHLTVDKDAWMKAVNGLVPADQIASMSDAEYSIYEQKWNAYCQDFFNKTVSANNFNYTSTDQATHITNIEQLTADQYQNLTNYALTLINQARHIWRDDNNEMSSELIDLTAAKEVANGYSNGNIDVSTNLTHLSHVVYGVAEKYHLGVGSDIWMNEQIGETFINNVIKHNGFISIAGIKNQLTNDILLMLFGDGGSNSWGHFFALMGGGTTDDSYNEDFKLGIAFDKFGHAHFTTRSTENIKGQTPDTTPIASTPSLNELQAQLATAKNDQATAQTTLADTQQQIDLATKALSTAQAANETAKSDLSKAQNLQATLTQKVTTLSTQLSQFQSQLNTDKNNLTQLQIELADLQTARKTQSQIVTAANAKVQSAADGLAKATANVNEKKTNLQAANQTLAAAKQAENDANANILISAQAAKSAVDKAKAANDTLATATQHVTDAQAKVLAITTQLTDFSTIKANALADLTDARDTLSNANKTLSATQHQLSTEQTALNKANAQLNNANVALTNAIQNVKDRQSEYAAAQAHLSKLVHAGEVLDIAEAILMETQDSLENAKDNYATAEQNVTVAKRELVAAQANLAHTNSALDHAQQVLKAHEVPTATTIASPQVQADDLLTQYNAAKHKSDVLKQHADDLHLAAQQAAAIAAKTGKTIDANHAVALRYQADQATEDYQAALAQTENLAKAVAEAFKTVAQPGDPITSTDTHPENPTHPVITIGKHTGIVLPSPTTTHQDHSAPEHLEKTTSNIGAPQSDNINNEDSHKIADHRLPQTDERQHSQPVVLGLLLAVLTLGLTRLNKRQN